MELLYRIVYVYNIRMRMENDAPLTGIMYTNIYPLFLFALFLPPLYLSSSIPKSIGGILYKDEIFISLGKTQQQQHNIEPGIGIATEKML